MNIINFLKREWWLFAIALIFLLSFYIRIQNIAPDRILSFDPIFQYRFTKYFVDWGHFPLWDELTYYVGRAILPQHNPPLMMYMTALLYWLQPFGWSLLTTCAYASALYGAAIVLPTFLLGRELSNEYGGLFAAILIGTAPQILVRTFGSSYDTDQMALLFLILTLYLWLRFSRKKTVANFSLALLGFVAYLLAWHMSVYSLMMITSFLVLYLIMGLISKTKFLKRFKIEENFKLKEFKSEIIFFIILTVCILLIDYLVGGNFFESLNGILNFALTPEKKIVNISIAELQPFNIFSLEGWNYAMGRFAIGDNIIDNFIFIFFVISMLSGLVILFHKKDLKILSFFITMLVVSVYITTRGIRFTEFSSAMFLVLIGAGLGYLSEWFGKNHFLKASIIGVGLFIGIIALIIGQQVGKNLGPDMDSNWDDAWNFLKTQTNELSIVGTWWDPGHMINGLAERRDYADGAHCGNPCLFTINDRIVDLGKIMVTSDENESLNLIRKYQGDSPTVYWIASDDLIGKFQWLQYFGTGCDARSEQRCPLYMQIPEQSRSTDSNGNIIIRNYGNVLVFQGLNIPIPFYVEGINGHLFDEIIYYSEGEAQTFKINETEKSFLIETLKPLEKQLNFRFSNQSIPMAVWIPQHYSYIVIIPQTLRNSVFTKMFMLEGKELEHFKQVFRNERVKIYEVI